VGQQEPIWVSQPFERDHMPEDMKHKKPWIGARLADGLIETFRPHRAFQRKLARRLNQLGPDWVLGGDYYRGAEADRRTDDFLTEDVSADKALDGNLETMRARAHDLVRNNTDASSIVKTICSNVVGTGIKLQSMIDWEQLGITEDMAEAFQNQAEKQFTSWLPYADAGGRLHFYEMQGQVQSEKVISGEALAIRQMVERTDTPFKTCIEIIDVNRLCTPIEYMNKGNVRFGVEIGEHGQATGYYIKGANVAGIPGSVKLKDCSYVPRFNKKTGTEDVLHLYVQERPGQTRGITGFAQSIDLQHHIERYVEAEVIAARGNACNGIMVETADPFGMAAGNTARINNNDERIENLKPGGVNYLSPGQTMKAYEFNRPGGQFEPFLMVMLRRFSAGFGLSYELIGKDYSKVTYSSARAALLQDYRIFRQWQYWLSRSFCQKVYQWVLEEAVMLGLLPIDGGTYMKNKGIWSGAIWLAPGWEWVDPLKEAQASVVAVKNGFSSVSDVVQAKGGDWEHTERQLKREVDRFSNDGLPHPIEQQQQGAQ